MEKEDLILEALKNSLEAGALNVDIYIDGNRFCIVDDGDLESLPTFTLNESSKGEKRGRGLYLVRKITRGRCSIRREENKTILEAETPSALEAEKVIPFCFNLHDGITFHSMRCGSEAYSMRKKDLEEIGIDPKRAPDVARLKRIIREKERGVSRNEKAYS